MTDTPAPLVLRRGRGSVVQAADGQELIDLELGFGAAFLGHGHPAVVAALQAQATQLVSCGRHATERTVAVEHLLAALLPAGMRPGGLGSTGMEMCEFALRVAATHTGRSEFAGLAKSMHGKSATTAALCWPNAPLRPQGVHSLPFVDTVTEAQALDALARCLEPRRVAALFIEPIQGSNHAHEATLDFHERAIALCHAHGTLVVFDETLTGLHRTGTPFYASRLRTLPDMLVFAKSLGNGFPAATLALAAHLDIAPGALPGSTFSGNALALAAVQASLGAMQALDMAGLVAAIEMRVRAMQPALERAGAVLRGRGALWCISFDDAAHCRRAHTRLRAAGVLLSCTDRALRLVPAATIEPALLDEACTKIVQACS
jgi:acetylornithine/succinyldiaminopimelate/putrescine aminotransferase